MKFFGAQATGCSPISDAVKNGKDRFDPQKPATIARSLAIGNPADGRYAAQAIRESCGWAAAVSDEELIAAIGLLAATTGVFLDLGCGYGPIAAVLASAAPEALVYAVDVNLRSPWGLSPQAVDALRGTGLKVGGNPNDDQTDLFNQMKGSG